MKNSVFLKRGVQALVSLLFVLSLPVFMVGCGHNDGGVAGGVTGSSAGGDMSPKSSLKIEMNASSIGVKTSKWLTAYYTSASGKTIDVSSKATWNSSDDCVRVEGGLLTGVSIGEATISASCYDCTAETIVTVLAVNDYCALIGEDNASPEANGFDFKPGSSQRVRVCAKLSDGSQQDITDSLRWSSSDEDIAKVSNEGVITAGCTKGSANITGRLRESSQDANDDGEGQVVAQFTVTVSGGEPEVVSVAIAEEEVQMPAGTGSELTAIATYDDGTTANVTLGAAWTSDADDVASVQLDVDRQVAKVTSYMIGKANISVAFGGKTAVWSADVTEAALTGLYFDADEMALANGLSGEVRVMGTYTDDSIVDVTSLLRFTTGNGEVAVMADDAAGRILAVSEGETVITAETLYGTYSASLKVMVTPAVVTDLNVDTSGFEVTNALIKDDGSDMGAAQDSALLLAKGLTKQFTIYAFYSDGARVEVTDLAAFRVSSEGQEFITVSDSGLVTALEEGEAVVLVEYSENEVVNSASVIIKVGPAALTSLSITPSTIHIPLGLSQQVKVEAFYSDAPENPVDVTSLVQYSITGEKADSVTVDNAGKVTAVIPEISGSLVSVPENYTLGEPTLTKTVSKAYGGTCLEVSYTDAVGRTADGRADVFVDAAVATEMSLNPDSTSVGVGEWIDVAATAKFSDNHSEEPSGNIEWISSDESVATVESVNGGCRVTGENAGNVTITATYTTATATFSASVDLQVIAYIRDAHIYGSTSLEVGAVGCYLATGYPGNSQDETAIMNMVRWESDGALECLGINEENGGMMFKAVSAGSATITIYPSAYGSDEELYKLDVTISEAQEALPLRNPLARKNMKLPDEI